MNNIKALKKSPLFLFLLVAMGISSCVSKVTIPDEEKPMFVVDLQMLDNSDDIHAIIKTTNTLNGILYPIERPEDVIITVQDLQVQDNKLQFVYNDMKDIYEYSATEDAIASLKTFKLSVELPGSNIPKVTSLSKVPVANKLVNTELISDKIVDDEDGNSYWQGTIKFNFENLNTNNSLFYHLALEERLQTKTLVGDEYVYNNVLQNGEKKPFEIISVKSGSFAAKEFIDHNGLWIDLDQLGDDESFEVEIRSSYAIEYDGQTSDNIFSNVTSITEEHYNYYLGLNNIKSSNTTLFNEKGLYRSNITNGVGLFSTCVENPVEINIAK